MTYTYVSRYFNGEIYDYVKEACEIIFELSSILDDDIQYVFTSIEEVLEIKTLNFNKKQISCNLEQSILNIEDTIKIFKNRTNILLALSDLIDLFKNYQIQLKEIKHSKKEKKEEFKNLNLSIKKGFKAEKKIYYYLCYSYTSDILSNDLLNILIQSLEFKNEEIKKIQQDISENKIKYDKIKEKNSQKSDIKVLIEEL